MVANIPFVRLRSGIPHFLLEGTASFDDSIRFARTAESEPLLEITGNSLSANGIAVLLKGINFAFYLWMIQQTVISDGTVKRLAEANMEEYAASFLSVYRQVSGAARDDDKTAKAFVKGMESQWLSERRSAVKKAFEKALGENVARLFLVHPNGKNTQRHYSIHLLPEHIVGFTLHNKP